MHTGTLLTGEMARIYKALMTALLVVGVSAGMSGCSDDDVEMSGSVEGTWRNVTSAYVAAGIVSYVQFLDDGTYREITVEDDSVGVAVSEWSITGVTITISESDDMSETTMTITKLTEEALEVVMMGFNLSYTRVDATEAEQYITADSLLTRSEPAESGSPELLAAEGVAKSGGLFVAPSSSPVLLATSAVAIGTYTRMMDGMVRIDNF